MTSKVITVTEIQTYTERDIARLVAFSSNLTTDTPISELMGRPPNNN